MSNPLLYQFANYCAMQGNNEILSAIALEIVNAGIRGEDTKPLKNKLVATAKLIYDPVLTEMVNISREYTEYEAALKEINARYPRNPDTGGVSFNKIKEKLVLDSEKGHIRIRHAQIEARFKKMVHFGTSSL